MDDELTDAPIKINKVTPSVQIKVIDGKVWTLLVNKAQIYKVPKVFKPTNISINTNIKKTLGTSIIYSPMFTLSLKFYRRQIWCIIYNTIRV